MKPIQWTDKLSMGVPSLDRQHKKIVHLLNRILTATDVTTDSEMVSDALTELTRYAKEHFQAEEAFFEKQGYPDLAVHKKQHAAYRRKIVELCQSTIEGAPTIPADLRNYLQFWWTNHILEEDLKYRDFANSRQQ